MKSSLRYKFGVGEIFGIIVGIFGFGILEAAANNGYFTNVYMRECVRSGLVTIISALCGPFVGGIVGLLGAESQGIFTSDVSWSLYSFSMCLLGIVVGIYAPKYGVREGEYDLKKLLFFNAVQARGVIFVFLMYRTLLRFIFYKDNLFNLIIEGCERAFYVSLFIAAFISIPFLFCSFLRKKFIKSK